MFKYKVQEIIDLITDISQTYQWRIYNITSPLGKVIHSMIILDESEIMGCCKPFLKDKSPRGRLLHYEHCKSLDHVINLCIAKRKEVK